MRNTIIIFSLFITINLCGQSSGCPNYDHHSIPKAEKIVDVILSKIGISRTFPILECSDINNALAVSLPTKYGTIKYIAYDYNFIKDIEYETGTKWAVIFILAHEVGHHLHDHLGSTHTNELEADKFAGFILGRLGASLTNTLSTIDEIGSHHDSDTHPNKEKRFDAIQKGWYQGDDELVAKGQRQNTSNGPVVIRPGRKTKYVVRTN